jgi:hypothetical protein
VGVNVAVLGTIGLNVPPGLTVVLDAIVSLFSPAMVMP